MEIMNKKRANDVKAVQVRAGRVGQFLRQGKRVVLAFRDEWFSRLRWSAASEGGPVDRERKIFAG